MRATKKLHQSLNNELSFLHSRRRSALWRCVEGLLDGGRVWVSALGRSLPGATSDKHRIKAADRFVGNSAIHSSLPRIYAAVAKWLLRGLRRAIVAVDWTQVGANHYALEAALCHQGRAITIFSRVFPKKLQCNPQAEMHFLAELGEVIPPGCTPIIVTDAGFRTPWFEAVQRQGWDFVGRLRNRTKFFVEGRWRSPATLHARAGRHARRLGRLTMRRSNPRTFGVVLAPKPTPKGRKKRTKTGRVKRGWLEARRARGAIQPWLLITSLDDSAKSVVGVYAKRMQIEETFRDYKNRRDGFALADIRSRDPKRIDVLLLLATLAHLMLVAVGLALEARNLHRPYQANSIRHRRVISYFALARRHVARHGFVDRRLAVAGLRTLHHAIRRAACL